MAVLQESYQFRKAATIEVPDEFFSPIVTGIRDIDEAWSEIGGIVPSQVTFITGKPGAGKTTLTLAVAACIAKNRPAAFISLEMSDFQLKNQCKKIRNFDLVDVTCTFDQDKTMEEIRKLKPGLIILDSVQKAARKMRDAEGKKMAFNTAQVAVVEMFTKYAKETWTPVFLIGHCDKAGNYKGPSDLLHDVDSHLLVDYDKEQDLRTFTFGKNRFGGITQESMFGITASTVWVGTPYIESVFGESSIKPTEPVTGTPFNTTIDEDGVAVCINALRAKWDGSTARATILAVVDYLKANDNHDGLLVKDPKRVKAQFRGNSLAHCHPRTGELVFGKKTFTATMEIGKVGYAKEQKFILARCNTKVDLLIWVIIHEWAHLFDGNDTHNNEFFTIVAEKYDWLMEKLQGKI